MNAYDPVFLSRRDRIEFHRKRAWREGVKSAWYLLTFRFERSVRHGQLSESHAALVDYLEGEHALTRPPESG